MHGKGKLIFCAAGTSFSWAACWFGVIFPATMSQWIVVPKELDTFADRLPIFVLMIRIEYPVKKPAVKTANGKECIFCMIRRRWVAITPEEWVRQNFLLYLTDVLHYPAALIAVEKQILLGELKKRFDIVVYRRDGTPYMMIECKEMNVPLSGHVLEQVLRYNINIQAAILVVTNGTYCAAFERSAAGFSELPELPIK